MTDGLTHVIISILVVFTFSIHAFCQDKIYLANGERKIGKVIEERRNYILVKFDSTYYQLSFDEVSLIVFSDGRSRVMGYIPTNLKKSKGLGLGVPDLMENPNQIEINLAALAFNYLELGYLRFLNPTWGIELYGGLGTGPFHHQYAFRRIFGMGVNAFIYPMEKNKRLNFYFGPGVETGRCYVSWKYYNYLYETKYYYESGRPIPNQMKGNYVAFGIKAGITTHIINKFYLNTELGLNLRFHFINDPLVTTFEYPFIPLHIGVQYRL